MLRKLILYYLLASPLLCVAQTKMTGRVINAADKNGIPNASVFLSNATVGAKTAQDGSRWEGSYKVVIEGIDENGNQGRQVYRYNVQ